MSITDISSNDYVKSWIIIIKSDTGSETGSETGSDTGSETGSDKDFMKLSLDEEPVSLTNLEENTNIIVNEDITVNPTNTENENIETHVEEKKKDFFVFFCAILILSTFIVMDIISIKSKCVNQIIPISFNLKVFFITDLSLLCFSYYFFISEIIGIYFISLERKIVYLNIIISNILQFIGMLNTLFVTYILYKYIHISFCEKFIWNYIISILVLKYFFLSAYVYCSLCNVLYYIKLYKNYIIRCNTESILPENENI
jgi:hypothetical protein